MESKNAGSDPGFDTIDKKILYAFSQDCRLNKKQLAGEMRISPERLHYRIEKLKGEYFEPGVVVDPLALDLPTYFLTANHLSTEAFEQISAKDEVYLAGSLVGLPEYIFVVITEDINDILQDMSSANARTHRLTSIQVDNFNGWGVDLEPEPTPSRKPLDITGKHREVLRETILNPEESAYQLSKHMDYHYKTIKKYQEELHSHGVIKKWRYQCDLFKMGFTPYFVHLRTRPGDTEQVKLFQFQNPNSGFLYQSTTDLFFWYITRHTNSVHEFTEKLQNKFSPPQITVSHIGDQYHIDMNTPILRQLA